MNNLTRIAIVALVAAGVATAVVLKQRDKTQSTQAGSETSLAASNNSSTSASPTLGKPLPKLLDLGAGKCIPCKMMAPILEELKEEYVGRMEVEFIDVWKNRDAADAFGVETIPTQIFLDASGKELFRHTGFYGKEDILAKWQELGVEINGDGRQTDGIE